jgi:carbamoyl-phosphate synthase large subunit
MAPIRELAAMGFRIIATRGTKRHLDAHGIEWKRLTRC